MEVAVGLIMMLLGMSHGVQTYCDGRQDGAQCYGALGGSVVLQLMDNASEITRYDWKKNTLVILKWRNNAIVSNTMEQRSNFFPSNGTLVINNLIGNDRGEYTLQIYNSKGHEAGRRTLQLTVQAPVSSVQLLSECLSQGEMKVSCSSEGGDGPQYSWTLDGRTLTDSELLSGSNETNNITLKQNVSGLLVCSAKNHISSVSKEKDISTCGFIFINCTSNGTHISKWVFKDNNSLCSDPTTAVPTTDTHRTVEHLWVILGALSALVILLVIGIVIICVQKKKQNNRGEEQEDDQDIIYADVRMVQRQGRRVEQRAEVEVEYGQVKFSKRPPRAEPAPDYSVYAKVCKVR
ncbi:uncharacterized protein ACNS7B_012393 isoform 3-T3 [Menidia menidia]